MVKQSFRNMALELNILNVCKQPSIDTDKVQDVNLIEYICKYVEIISLCIFDLLEMAPVIDADFLNKFKLDDVIQFANYINNTHYMNVVGWIPKKEVFKELPSQTMKLIPSSIKAPILEIKPLPKDFQCVFLGYKKNFAVVI